MKPTNKLAENAVHPNKNEIFLGFLKVEANWLEIAMRQSQAEDDPIPVKILAKMRVSREFEKEKSIHPKDNKILKNMEI